MFVQLLVFSLMLKEIEKVPSERDRKKKLCALQKKGVDSQCRLALLRVSFVVRISPILSPPFSSANPVMFFGAFRPLPCSHPPSPLRGPRHRVGFLN